MLDDIAALEAVPATFATLAFVTTADDVTAANQIHISVTGCVFTFAANSTYVLEFFGATRAAADTTGSGFALVVSVAVTSMNLQFVHQLANATGTLTGGSSIADAAVTGISSGRPGADTDTPVYGSGVLRSGAGTGTAQLQYRSEVNAVSRVLAGFVMRVHKIG
jgi:hypothetical protein